MSHKPGPVTLDGKGTKTRPEASGIGSIFLRHQTTEAHGQCGPDRVPLHHSPEWHRTVRMSRSPGRTNPPLLPIVIVLCHSDYGLKCYNCINQVSQCNSSSECPPDLNACILVQLESELHYYHCWTFNNCNYDYIAKTLQEKKFKYKCCQEDLCNRNAGTTVSGKTVLLVIPLLAAAWNLCL